MDATGTVTKIIKRKTEHGSVYRERNHKAHFVREVGRDSAGKIHLVEITWHGREWRELSK